MKRSILILSIINLFTFNLNAQNSIALPEANSAALAKFGKIPVDYSTGTLGVNVPIYTLGVDDYQLTVGLGYHASGIKVNETASSVGLGWALQAGGQVSRTIKGLPDESSNGYCGTNKRMQFLENEPDPTNYDKDDLKKVYDKDWDGQPDQFIANINGRSIMFVFDIDRNIHTIPESAVHIEAEFDDSGDGEITEFEVTDEEGNIYVFGDAANYRGTTRSTVHGESDVLEDITTWYLHKIHTLRGNEINFAYSTGNDYSFKSINRFEEREYAFQEIGNGCDGKNLDVSEKTKDITTTIKSPKYLVGISSPYGDIRFETNTGRTDLSGALSYSRIYVENWSDKIVRDVKLSYGYFISTNCSGTTESCQRLKLTSVKNQLLNDLKEFEFIYNESTNLPSRHSRSYDHWGYYNDETDNSSTHVVEYSDDTYSFSGADRTSSSTKQSANILTRINFPTGGYRRFEYEPNQYLDGSNTIYIGGLRIAKSFESDGSQELETSYSYSGLTMKGNPNYYVKYDKFENSQCIAKSINRYSSSLSNLFDLNGYHLVYDEVTVTDPNEGYTTYKYDDFQDFPDESSLLYANYLRSVGGLPIYYSGRWNYNTHPFAQDTYLGFFRNRLKNVKSFDSDGNIQTETTYNYDESILVNETTVPAVVVSELAWGNTWDLRFRRYDFKTGFIRLNSVTNRTYDPSDDTKYFDITTSYAYNNNPPRASTESVLYPDGHSEKTYYRYPHDLPFSSIPLVGLSDEAGGLFWLKARNVISPIETIYEINGNKKKVEINLWKYDTDNSILVPTRDLVGHAIDNSYDDLDLSAEKTQLEFDGNVNFEEQIAYTSYDSRGNLLSSTGIDGITQTNEYGYGNTLQTASVVSSGSSQFRTEYTWDPLVGVTRIKDPNNISSYYSYDPAHRLQSIKDNNNDIVETYRYNYATQTNVLSGTYQISGCHVVNESTNFEHTGDKPLNGENRYLWDFGDGNIEETSTVYSSHVYSSTGTYETSLTILNPEYETVQVKKSRTIQNEFTSISIISLQLPSEIQPPSGSLKPFYIVANVEGGSYCGSINYTWKYRTLPSGGWITASGNNANIVLTPPDGVTWQVELDWQNGSRSGTTSSLSITGESTPPEEEQ